MRTTPWILSPDRCFNAEPAQRAVARQLYATVKQLPLICPHGHVNPALLADPAARLGSPADLFIIPDHYIFRMLYSQGVPLEELGIPTQDGTPVETDHRRIWQRFADHFYLFRGTPTGLWLMDELINIFGIDEPLNSVSAQRIYDQLAARLAQPDFTPQALLNRFQIELLCTTDAASDRLDHHRSLHKNGFDQIRPTFRPDAVVNLQTPGWHDQIEALGAAAGTDIVDYTSFIHALEERRGFFKQQGAVATDHSAETAYTALLPNNEAAAIFGRALAGRSLPADPPCFTGHMLVELARMSVEDGLVMQMHVGSHRNHNPFVFTRFGPDTGADIPLHAEWTHNLRPLLNRYGNDPRLRLILFTLDESSYSRELAPLAGHYPAVRLGPPWWFFDSVNGMRRYLERVVETAGLYNTVGFNDDTRAFVSIPTRHDVWRRVTCNWLAGLVVEGLLPEDAAHELARECAYELPRRAYRLE